MSAADKPGPEFSESDRQALDAIRRERDIEDELRKRAAARRESIKSWALWFSAISGAYAAMKDGALWKALRSLLGIGP